MFAAQKQKNIITRTLIAIEMVMIISVFAATPISVFALTTNNSTFWDGIFGYGTMQNTGAVDIAVNDPALSTEINASRSITKIIQWLLGITGFITMLVIVWGGVMYMLALGDENRAAKAKKILFYAIAGLLIIMLSYAILYFVTTAIVK